MTDPQTHQDDAAAALEADRRIDITAERCPMTLVRTRLALDGMAAGELLEVLLAGEEPRRSIPEASFLLGHDVLATDDLADGRTRVLIRKA